jgi:hypothetical protein
MLIVPRFPFKEKGTQMFTAVIVLLSLSLFVQLIQVGALSNMKEELQKLRGATIFGTTVDEPPYGRK